MGSVCGCCCCHTVPLCFPPAADVLKSSERSKFSHTLYCHSRKTTPARPGSKLLQQLPTPHLHRPPPPTATAVKGRDPTQNLEAGRQWLFLFCTAITEHQNIRCCSFVWVSGSQGFYASCLIQYFRRSLPKHGTFVQLFVRAVQTLPDVEHKYRLSKQMLALCIDVAIQACSELFISSAQTLRNTIHLLTNFGVFCFGLGFFCGKNIPRELIENPNKINLGCKSAENCRHAGSRNTNVTRCAINQPRLKPFAAFNVQARSINPFEEGKQPLCRR